MQPVHHQLAHTRLRQQRRTASSLHSSVTLAGLLSLFNGAFTMSDFLYIILAGGVICVFTGNLLGIACLKCSPVVYYPLDNAASGYVAGAGQLLEHAFLTRQGISA
eukprot:GHRR01016604.1.p2 GENE.GHRR01016604.1~~GHRR01016604.1.p2  ORF type:complete len:106 (+),score=16.44 GHRR01016604.1:662-979(+)